MLKALFYILIAIAAIVSLFVLTMVVISKIYLKPFDKSDIKKIDLTKLSQGKVGLRVNSSIRNENNFDIPFSDLYFEVYHQDQLVSSSPNGDIIVNGKATKEGSLVKNGVFSFQKDIDIYLNPDIIIIVKDIALNKPVEFNYALRFKVFGVRIKTIRDTFTI